MIILITAITTFLGLVLVLYAIVSMANPNINFDNFKKWAKDFYDKNLNPELRKQRQEEERIAFEKEQIALAEERERRKREAKIRKEKEENEIRKNLREIVSDFGVNIPEEDFLKVNGDIRKDIDRLRKQIKKMKTDVLNNKKIKPVRSPRPPRPPKPSRRS